MANADDGRAGARPVSTPQPDLDGPMDSALEGLSPTI